MKNLSFRKKSIDFSKYYPLFFTIIFVVILFQYSLSSLEAIFYDFRIRYDFGTSFDDNIVLITLDEESDEFLGEKYPYTYASHERLLKKLSKDRPAIINYFITLFEPETKYDQENLKQLKKTILDFRKNGGKFRFGTKLVEWGSLLPPQELLDIGYSLSVINKDDMIFAKDGVSRRALLNISGEDSIHLWTANKYRKMNGAEELDVNTILGSYYSGAADATFTLYRYYTNPVEGETKIKSIPFHRVVVGNFPKGFFKNKIILVGPSYITKFPENYVLTPFNKEQRKLSNKDRRKSSKLSVHAQIIQSLIQNKTIYQLPIKVTYILAIIIAIVLSVTISNLRPTRGLLITVLVLFGVVIFSYLIFSIMGVWLYMTHLILTIFVVYYIWVPFRAIEEYQTRFAIQEEAKLLKKVENLKQNFISLMSHDLKTPVAKIAGLADILLKQYQKDELLKRNLMSIIDSTKDLNRFITSILDLTKIESRNLTLNKVSKDINPLIESIVGQLKFEAASKNISFQLNLSPLYPIEIDVALMNRVISNLIENAIKYSGNGAQVKVETMDDEKWVYIFIEDNGVGISKEDLSHIFDKFYRVRNDASHRIKGTGLGLYLVKYFVELQGGLITVDSTPGKGTKFQVQLKNA